MSRFMKELTDQFKASAAEFGSASTLAVCGMMAAVGVVAGYFTIAIGDFLKIGFATIPNQVVYALFGPSVGCAYGGALDILKYIVKPTGPFFPGFTLNAMLAGVLYGVSFYRHELTFRRVLITEFIVSLIINILLNTLWISMLYGKAFMVLLPARAMKNLIQVPINAAVFYSLSRILQGFRLLKRIRS